MWDWYNRPGGLSRIAAWKFALALALIACAVSVVLWLLYSLVAQFLFTPVNR